MDSETLKALRGSIAKWEAICMGCGEDDGGRNCPLCQLFSDPPCHKCPVDEYSQDCCSSTPYDQWTDYFPDYFITPRKANANNIDLALAELEFLYSLLPEGE